MPNYCEPDRYWVELKPLNVPFPIQLAVPANSRYEAMEKAWGLINYADIDKFHGITAGRLP